MQRLTQRPTTVEDIGRAKREWKEISDSKAAMKTQFRWATCVPTRAPTVMSHACFDVALPVLSNSVVGPVSVSVASPGPATTRSACCCPWLVATSSCLRCRCVAVTPASNVMHHTRNVAAAPHVDHGMSHMAEYTCCCSVAFERPNENTFTVCDFSPRPFSVPLLVQVSVRMARLNDDWQNLDVAIKAFDDMIEEQRSAIRASVEGEVGVGVGGKGV
jgi:hypothetical protein